jgi:hypothetical protein
VKVGNTIEYYAPEAVVGNLFNICQGVTTTILPNDSFQKMTDVHFYIDGLIPIFMDDPFNLKKANGFTLITAIVLLGMTRVLPFAEFWDSFWILRKGQRKISLHPINQRNWKM